MTAQKVIPVTREGFAALQESVLKWEWNAKQTDTHRLSLGQKACPLCCLYNPYGFSAYSEMLTEPCEGCPIREATGEDFCRGTPYDNVLDALAADDFRLAISYVTDELQFLKSLVPMCVITDGDE